MSTSNTIYFSKHSKLKGSREDTEATLYPRTECSIPMPEQPLWLVGCHAPALKQNLKPAAASSATHTYP